MIPKEKILNYLINFLEYTEFEANHLFNKDGENCIEYYHKQMCLKFNKK